MKVYFVRHGESVLGEQKHQLPESPLSEIGIKQAATIAQRFTHIPIDLILTSSYTRAIQTAQAIEKIKGVPLIKSDLLIEEYKMKKEIERQELLQVKEKMADGSKDWQQKASNFFSLCCNATNEFLRAKEDKQYLFLRKITSNVFLDNKQLIFTHEYPFSQLAKRGTHPSVLRDEDSNLGP